MDKEQQIRELIGGSWYNVLKDEFDAPYMDEINKVLGSQPYYPAKTDVFRALMYCGFEEARVVILGQDPYHDGQANGLAFSTKSKMNPSIEKILDALDDDIKFGKYLEYKNNLSYLCNKGVLLLNTALTVSPGKPGSHSNMWKPFTEAIIKALSNKQQPVVFLLWGKHAQEYTKFIDPFNHKIIQCEHPAAAAYAKRPWEHNECFSETQSFIETHYGERYSNIW